MDTVSLHFVKRWRSPNQDAGPLRELKYCLLAKREQVLTGCDLQVVTPKSSELKKDSIYSPIANTAFAVISLSTQKNQTHQGEQF